MNARPARSVSYARTFGRVLAGVAGAASLLAPVLEPGPRNAVWASACAILAYVGLERLAAWRWPGRSISLLRATLLIATAPPFFLILATFVEGEATYRNTSGNFSHGDQAWKVALAGVVLLASAVVGAAFAGRGRTVSTLAVTELRTGYSRTFLNLLCWMAAAHGVTRLLIVFAGGEIPVAIAYALRLYLSLYMAVYIYLGMALRARMLTARVAIVVTAGVSLLVLLSGGRSDALFPILYLGLGYVLAQPTSRRSLARGALVAIPAFLLAMYVGGVLRGDQRGRTGAAAMARLDQFGVTLSESSELTSFANSTLRRMVSNSTHSVLTRIPSEVPFERDGLRKLPEEFADRLLPRLNLSGVSDTEKPRNWMLNDLGFLVTWSTRVELAMVADSWYRGGWAGVLLVGLILGLFLQLLENGVYLAMRRSPQFSALLVFCCTGLIQIAARDIVAAFRTMAFLAMAAVVVVTLALILEARRGGATFATRRRPTASRYRSASTLHLR